MWKPAQGRNFYPFGFDTKYCHVSQIPELDANREDILKKFPKFVSSQEPQLDVHMESGDMIYIPRCEI
jgi:septum formation topological specificity factor MinE